MVVAPAAVAGLLHPVVLRAPPRRRARQLVVARAVRRPRTPAVTSRRAARSRSSRMARATSRLTRAWETAISRRPLSQIGSDTRERDRRHVPRAREEACRRTGCVAGQGERWAGTRRARPLSAEADAARSSARAARYCGPCASASCTASASAERQVGRPGGVDGLRRPPARSRRRAGRAAAAPPSARRPAGAGRSAPGSARAPAGASRSAPRRPTSTRARATASPSSARRMRSRATRPSSWFCSTA